MESQDKLSLACGQLFIVATPIGNLKDMTYRAIETLKNADWIAAEDTRVSRRLLDHYDIKTSLFACHDHNEAKVAKVMIERLKSGESGALISDAGTPLINDPGYRLVRAVREQGLDVVPIPGACSPIAALCASGLATDQFTYMGFLPRNGGSRSQQLQILAQATHTCVFLESPKRIVKTLQDMLALMPYKELCIGRELTKLHEQFISGSAAELIEHFDKYVPRGEMVVMVGLSKIKLEVSDDLIVSLASEVAYQDLSPSSKAKAIAQQLGVKRSRVYELLLQK
ncbi:MAG: 16S rRNA (cytidine(1402)-2'-O)-methyltransferase [Mariprofundaceae bacterium]